MHSPIYFIVLIVLAVSLVALVIIARRVGERAAPEENKLKEKPEMTTRAIAQKLGLFGKKGGNKSGSTGTSIAASEELVHVQDIIANRFYLTTQGELISILRVVPIIRTTQDSSENYVDNFVQVVKNIPPNTSVQVVQMPLPSRIEGLTDYYAGWAHTWLKKRGQAELEGDQQKLLYYNSRFFLANIIGLDILDTSSMAPRRESYFVVTKDISRITGHITPEQVAKEAGAFQTQVDQFFALCSSADLCLEQMPIEGSLDVLWYAYNPDQGASALRERAIERYEELFEKGYSEIPATSGLSQKNIREILSDPAKNLRSGLAPRQVSTENAQESRIEFPGKVITPYFVLDYRSVVPSINRLLGDGNRFADKLVVSYFIDSPPADVVARETRKASTTKQAVEAVRERLGGTLPSYRHSEEVAAIEEARYGAETEKDVTKFLSLYMSLISNEGEEYQDRIDFEAILAALNINFIPGRWISTQVWQSTLPLGRKYLRNEEGRNVRAQDIGGLNPVTALSDFDPQGHFLGYTPVTRSSLMPVAIKRARGSVIRPGEAVVGAPGSGKSFTLKFWMTNWAALGERIFVIDPKAEFRGITQRLQGSVIELLGGGGFNLLQFDKVEAPAGTKRAKALTDMIWEDNLASLISLYERVKGDRVSVTGVEHAHLMNALSAAMGQCGMDPRDGSTWTKNQIFLTDVYKVLGSPEIFEEDPDTIKMMLKILEPYATRNGHYYNMFNTPVTLDFSNDINTIIFGTSQFSADPRFNFLAYHFALKSAAQHALRAFVLNEEAFVPYHIVLDEASQILVTPTIVGAVSKMLSLFQTYGISLHMAFQDMNAITNADELTRGVSSGSGNTLSSLIPAYWLFKQETNSALLAGKLLNLPQQEVKWLPRQNIGSCILVFSGEKRIPIYIKVPEPLVDLFKTDPEQMKHIVQEMLEDETGLDEGEVEIELEEKYGGVFG